MKPSIRKILTITCILSFVLPAWSTNREDELITAFQEAYELFDEAGVCSSLNSLVEEGETNTVNTIRFLLIGFEQLADIMHDPETPPSSNLSYQNFMFEEFSDCFPYYDLLWEIAEFEAP